MGEFPLTQNIPSRREEVGVPMRLRDACLGKLKLAVFSRTPSPGLQIQKAAQGRRRMPSVAEKRFPDLLAACKLSTELKDAAYITRHLCQVGLSPVSGRLLREAAVFECL